MTKKFFQNKNLGLLTNKKLDSPPTMASMVAPTVTIPTKLSYGVWGPRTWDAMMAFAMSYPYQPNAADKELARVFYETIVVKLLVCPQCPPHYLEMLTTYPPDVSNRPALIEWNIKVHNLVNARLHKPILDYATVMTAWHGVGYADTLAVEARYHGYNPVTANLPSVPATSLKSTLFILAVLVALLTLGVIIVALYYKDGSHVQRHLNTNSSVVF
jgi:hypothetical protein